MWRVLSILIVMFWAVMTSLLVRYTWFPEGSAFAQVPPRVVLKQFLEQGSAVSTASTFHIYRQDRKLGQASVSCRRLRTQVDATEADFSVRFDGTLDKGATANADETYSFGVELKLRDVEHFAGTRGHVRMEKSRTLTTFTWEPGARQPSITVKREGKMVLDDQLIQPMIAQMLGGGAAENLAGNLGVAPETDIGSLVKVKARETVKVFAGQKSKGYTLEWIILDRWRVRAFLTEAGELALLDLPEGYRLVEPVIHGLAPEYDDEEEPGAVQDAGAGVQKSKDKG
jgi:hypothetical protein